MTNSNGKSPCILYCNCTYAQIIPPDVKREVLSALGASGRAFDAVPDLCDMSARKDPALARLAASGPIKIAACYERAVRWLFHAAGCSLPSGGVEVVNMREVDAETATASLLGPITEGKGGE